MGDYLNISTSLAAEMVGFRADLVLTNSPDTEPSLAEAITQLNEMEDEVNAAITRANYTAPVTIATNPLSYGLVVQGMKAGLAAWIYRAKGYSPETGDVTADVIVLEKKYADMIDKIENMPGYLIDGTVTANGPNIPLGRTLTSLFVVDTDVVDDRAFTRKMDY